MCDEVGLHRAETVGCRPGRLVNDETKDPRSHLRSGDSCGLAGPAADGLQRDRATLFGGKPVARGARAARQARGHAAIAGRGGC